MQQVRGQTSLVTKNRNTVCTRFGTEARSDLGVQQCFGVVYHELTTLRRVYFARAALAAQAK